MSASYDLWEQRVYAQQRVYGRPQPNSNVKKAVRKRRDSYLNSPHRENDLGSGRGTALRWKWLVWLFSDLGRVVGRSGGGWVILHPSLPSLHLYRLFGRSTPCNHNTVLITRRTVTSSHASCLVTGHYKSTATLIQYMFVALHSPGWLFSKVSVKRCTTNHRSIHNFFYFLIPTSLYDSFYNLSMICNSDFSRS